ncbi:MAG: hypothetical protein AB8B93_05450 [Pseudomonadales bacterium]
MFSQDHGYSTVTAVMPGNSSRAVIESVFERTGASALMWSARGTLIQDHWRRRWLPAVSPARTMIQMLVPDAEVAAVVANVVHTGRLDQQATGAVFSSPCEHTYLGSGFQAWPVAQVSAASPVKLDLTASLSAIYCIVGHARSERVTRAAMDAGAHGPIVYYSEGRGLRDRLGWLRITKEAEKEVLMVVAEETDAEEVFTAMAKAGQLHLPGRGFMYRMPITAGLYNLPSRVSHHHYDANMQQVINAIDHLAGHSHWRDQSVVDIGGGKGAGIDALPAGGTVLEDYKSLTAIVDRDQLQPLMDLLLSAGAPGLNVNHARFAAPGASGSRVNCEYSQVRCITDAPAAAQIATRVEAQAEACGLDDLCLLVQEVPRVITYVPGTKNHRRGRAA